MKAPTSDSENRTYGAEKIGLSRCSDFFNRIGQRRLIDDVRIMSAYPSGQSLPKFDVRVRSAFHPIASKSPTSGHFGSGPSAEVANAT